MDRISLSSYICYMETTQNLIDRKGNSLAIKANEARIELFKYVLATRNGLTDMQKMTLKKQIEGCERVIRRSEAKIAELLREDTDLMIFLSDFRNLTQKIYIFEKILANENSFENSKNVKKYIKRRKQLKNAYLKSSGMDLSELNKIIEGSLKTA